LPFHAAGTNMSGAFNALRRAGITHAVLITDGMPDSPDAALLAAEGLKLDIFYVGPQPVPAFLGDLARRTGGAFGATTLRGSTDHQLTSAVRALLTAGG
jgi:hypothetical protein